MSYFITQKALDLLMRKYFSRFNRNTVKKPTEKNRNAYWQADRFALKQCLIDHDYDPILFEVSLTPYEADSINFEGLSLYRVRLHHKDAHLTARHKGFVVYQKKGS